VIWDLLTQHLSLQVASVAGGVYALYKYRRVKSIIGVVIGGIGTLGFAGAVLVGGGALAVAMGWLDLGALVTDSIAAADTLWSAVGDRVVEAVRGVLP